MRRFSPIAIGLLALAGTAHAAEGLDLSLLDLDTDTTLSTGQGLSLSALTESAKRSPAVNDLPTGIRSRLDEDLDGQFWRFGTTLTGHPEQSYRRKPGKVTVIRARADIDGIVPVTERHNLLLGYTHESSWWEFDNTVITPRFFGIPVDGRGSFIDARGTDSITRYTTTDTIRIGMDNKLTDEWSLEYGGSYSLSRDPAGDFDSSQYGSGRFIVHNHLSEDLSVGLGVEIQSRLFRSPLYLPAIIIDWQIDDVTLLQTGTRSISLHREVTDTFSLEFDVSWELRQYRLPHDGIFAPLDAFSSFSVVTNQVPLPGFSFEELSVPAKVTGKWQIGQNSYFSAFVGATLYREIKYFFPDNWDRVGAQPGTRLESFEFDPNIFGGIGFEFTN